MAPACRCLRNLYLLAIPALSLTGALQAQAPFDACVDRAGAKIPSRTNSKMDGYGGMAGYEKGKPIILWNAKYLANAPEYQQLLVYLHECAHHDLGHLWTDNGAKPELANEIEADCWAIQLMVDGGMIGQFQFDSLLEREGRKQGDGDHLGGVEQVRTLQRCLSVRTDPKAWAEALPPLIESGKRHFVDSRGRELEATERDTLWESKLDLPGTYDCEVMGTVRVRCNVYMSKDSKSAANRFKKLMGIVGDLAPADWARVDNPSPSGPFARAFHTQDPESGVTLSLLLGTDPRVYFVVTAPKS